MRTFDATPFLGTIDSVISVDVRIDHRSDSITSRSAPFVESWFYQNFTRNWLTPFFCAVLIACLFEGWSYRRWPIGNSKPGFLPMMQGLCVSQLMVLAVFSYGGVVKIEIVALYAVA